MGTLTSIIDPSIKRPGLFLKVSLGVGPRSPGSGPMKIVVFGNKTASGTAAVAELKPVYAEADAKGYWGPGSEMHLGLKAAFKAYPAAVLFGIAIAEAGTPATKTATFTAGPATTVGTIEEWVAGERVVVDIAIGDTITNVAANLSAAVTAKTDWPVTSAPAAGVQTLTAKNNGPRGNQISVRTKLTGATGIAHTPVTGYMTTGATYDDPQAALDAIASERFHLYVTPYFTATELGKFKTHIAAQADPLSGKRARVLSAFPGTLANGITLTGTLNAPRMEVVWQENPDDTPMMIAAANAAMLAKNRSSDRAFNTDAMIVTGLKPTFSSADIPISSEIESALKNGLTPLLTSNGEVQVVRSVTTYYKDAAGNADYSVIDTHYVDVADFVADDIEVNHYARYKGFKLAPDSKEGPGPLVATPKSLRSFIHERLKTHDGKLIVRVDELLDNLIVEIDGTVPSRANAAIPIDVIELFHQAAYDVQQVG